MATTQPKPTTRAQFDAAVQTFELESAKLARLEADRQRDMQKISGKYAQPIAEAHAAIETAEATAKAYAEANPAELLPVGKSSVVIGQVCVGRRKLAGALAVAAGHSWETATAALQKMLPDFVYQVPTPDKEALKDALKDDKTKEYVRKRIAAAGVVLQTGFRYYVEIKKA